MSNGNDKLSGLTAPIVARPRLVVLKSEPTLEAAPCAGAANAAATEGIPRPKSNLARFMTSYADAIDRDIKLLLDL